MNGDMSEVGAVLSAAPLVTSADETRDPSRVGALTILLDVVDVVEVIKAVDLIDLIDVGRGVY